MADLSFVPYFGPLLAYLLVALVIGAILLQTKLLGASKWLAIFVALAVATLFIASAGAIDYVTIVTPWIAILVISLFFIFLLSGFTGMVSGDKSIKPIKGMTGLVVILAGVVFLVSAFVVYSNTLLQYFPFSDSYVGNETTDFLFSPRVVGAALLLIVAAFVSRVLIKN